MNWFPLAKFLRQLLKRVHFTCTISWSSHGWPTSSPRDHAQLPTRGVRKQQWDWPLHLTAARTQCKVHYKHVARGRTKAASAQHATGGRKSFHRPIQRWKLLYSQNPQTHPVTDRFIWYWFIADPNILSTFIFLTSQNLINFNDFWSAKS